MVPTSMSKTRFVRRKLHLHTYIYNYIHTVLLANSPLSLSLSQYWTADRLARLLWQTHLHLETQRSSTFLWQPRRQSFSTHHTLRTRRHAPHDRRLDPSAATTKRWSNIYRTEARTLATTYLRAETAAFDPPIAPPLNSVIAVPVPETFFNPPYTTLLLSVFLLMSQWKCNLSQPSSVQLRAALKLQLYPLQMKKTWWGQWMLLSRRNNRLSSAPGYPSL